MGSKRWILLGAGVLILAVGGFFVWLHYQGRESTDDAQVDGHIDPISAKLGGTVTAVNVDDNQVVKQGDVLVQIDPRDYNVALDRARADVAQAEAMLQASRSDIPITRTNTAGQLSSANAGVEEARATVVSSESEISAARARLITAQARVREAEANYQKAAKDLDRLKPLVAKEEISRQQYDAAVAAAEALRATVDSARSGVSEAEQDIRTAQSNVQRDQAKVSQAQATAESAGTAPQQVAATRAREQSAAAKVQESKSALEQAELNLQYATIRAPASGVISRKSVEVGQIVQPGQPLFAIVPLNDVWVTANFKETQLKDMRVGQRAEIDVDAYGRKYKGHVDSIAAVTGAKTSLLPPENATGNYVKVVQRVPVKIVLEKGEDSDHRLRPGLSVKPTVFTK
ncbi:MAG: HlyD family secretion protein [Acidobacteriota bacterium]|nr:HlyD family secretion protein [Acidobacteriota bacterium]